MTTEETVALLEKLRDEQTNAVSRQAFNMAIATVRESTGRRQGKWLPIRRGEKGYSAGDFRCSECGEPKRSYVAKPNYCQNCGAEMKEKK